jgi:hypothetical protein
MSSPCNNARRIVFLYPHKADRKFNCFAHDWNFVLENVQIFVNLVGRINLQG